MSKKEEILRKIFEAKESHLELPVHDDKGDVVATMTILGLRPEVEVPLVAEWRERDKDSYPTVFAYNVESTKNWVQKYALGNPERLLFFLYTLDGVPWGHVGISSFDFSDANDPFCELDAVARGRNDLLPGAMTHVVNTMLRWTVRHLGISRIGLRVFADKDKAIRLYERTGFRRNRLIPLKFVPGEPISSWKECAPGERGERDFLVMMLSEEALSKLR